MLADGISYRTIAREMRLSPSSVARYASGRKSDLARIADHETSTADVLSRLAAAADHATELRQQSRMGSTPSQQSRAIATEVQILTKILDELGIDDLAIGEYTAAVEALISGIQRFTRGHPGSADDLIKTLAADPATIDLATALKRQIESSN